MHIGTQNLHVRGTAMLIDYRTTHWTQTDGLVSLEVSVWFGISLVRAKAERYIRDTDPTLND